MPKFKIRLNRAGEWYWVFIAANGEAMAVSESYTSRYDARRSAERMKALVPISTIE